MVVREVKGEEIDDELPGDTCKRLYEFCQDISTPFWKRGSEVLFVPGGRVSVSVHSVCGRICEVMRKSDE